jgi:hypothetical protein
MSSTHTEQLNPVEGNRAALEESQQIIASAENFSASSVEDLRECRREFGNRQDVAEVGLKDFNHRLDVVEVDLKDFNHRLDVAKADLKDFNHRLRLVEGRLRSPGVQVGVVVKNWAKGHSADRERDANHMGNRSDPTQRHSEQSDSSTA